MSGEPTSASSRPPAQAGYEGPDLDEPRPWTPAAAMEPVPPLAPPPARPGAGLPVLIGGRPQPNGGLRALVVLAVVVLIAVVLVILLLAGRL